MLHKMRSVSLNNAGMTTVTCFADCMRAVHQLEVFYKNVSHKLMWFRPALPITNTMDKLYGTFGFVYWWLI